MISGGDISPPPTELFSTGNYGRRRAVRKRFFDHGTARCRSISDMRNKPNSVDIRSQQISFVSNRLDHAGISAVITEFASEAGYPEVNAPIQAVPFGAENSVVQFIPGYGPTGVLGQIPKDFELGIGQVDARTVDRQE